MNTDARQRVAEARIVARKKMPYLSHQVLSMTPIERPGLGTMCVDKWLRVYYDPAFVLDPKKTLDDLAFIVLHEGLHPLYLHHIRGPKILGERPSPQRLGLYRLAVDAAVNDTLITSGLKCPEGGVTPQSLGLPGKLSMEEYFERLLEKAEEERKKQEAEEKARQEAQKNQGDDSNGDQQDQDEGEGDDAGSQGDRQDDSQDPEGEGQEGRPEEGQDQDYSPGSDEGSGDQDEGGGEGQGETEGSEGEGQGQGDMEGSEDGGEEGQGRGEVQDEGVHEGGCGQGDEGEGGGDPDLEGQSSDMAGSGDRRKGSGSLGGDGPEAGGSDLANADGRDGGGRRLAPGAEYDGPPPDRSQGDGGSGCDGIDRPWECGEPTDKTPGLAEHEQELLRDVVAKEIEDYQRAKGNVPGGLLRVAKRILKPKVDPVRLLESMLRHCVTTAPGFGRWTFRKASRRSPPEGTILPANVRPIPRLAIIGDTSGSMREKDLALTLGVADRVLKGLVNRSEVVVYTGDTHVAAVSKIVRPDQIKFAGGGGTCMDVLLEEVAKTKPLPQVVLICTDGETGWPEHPLPFRVLVCLTRQTQWCPPPPSWMSKVVLHPEE